ncbi:N-6 DNA methylase [Paraburkholderia sp. A1RI-2L]|uniref:N-6 DNA methylase n=1 Tax=Paraburkholderia sp. A1RI-2L TaxID=3028367 RepID=UPI003B7EDEBF
MSEFADRIDKRAVFLTPQGVLFNKGQEQRLRETLLRRDGKGSRIKAVVTLPPGVFGSTGIAGAITVISNDAAKDTIYMADLGHGRRALVEAGDIVSAGREIALGLLESDKALVQPGDIVITIKGSVGRVALMGTSAHRQPIILSQSCLALRLRPSLGDKNLSPEVLLMYLRSPHGQAQLTGLQVGAGVQHISPATLLGTVSVPIPSEQAYVEIRHDYDRLCELEDQITNIESEIVNISSRRWPDNNCSALSVNETA